MIAPAAEHPVRKPWFKKWWVWFLALLAVGLVGQALGVRAPEPAPVATPVAESPAAESPVPAYDAMAYAAEAQSAMLNAHGVSSFGEIGSPDSPDNLLVHITAVSSPAPGEIVVTVTSPHPVDRENARRVAGLLFGQVGSLSVPLTQVTIQTADGSVSASNLSPVPTATTGGLGLEAAKSVCEAYGALAHPSGFDPKFFGEDVLSYRADSDDIFTRFAVAVKDEYGLEQEVTVECAVTGSEAEPQVTLFDTY